jgi:type IV secretory pathway TrbF-like protein
VYEVAYFEGERTTDDIAEELDCSEELVYRHMKHHFQPLVKKSANAIVAINVGQEIDILRNNVQSLNGKLSQFMNETSIHDDGVITDMVKLHKEVRETLKDLTTYQEKWAEPSANIANNTINVLKVELGKESPDTWKRVKASLLSQADGSIDEELLEIL